MESLSDMVRANYDRCTRSEASVWRVLAGSTVATQSQGGDEGNVPTLSGRLTPGSVIIRATATRPMLRPG